MGFTDSIRKSIKTVQEDINTATNKIAIDLFTEVVKRTPIADGTFGPPGTLVNNWYFGQGIGNYNTSFSASPNPSANTSYNEIARARDSKEFIGKDGEISLTNSTSYGYRAEYIGWPKPKWSGRVGPYAMVRNSLTVISAKYK